MTPGSGSGKKGLCARDHTAGEVATDDQSYSQGTNRLTWIYTSTTRGFLRFGPSAQNFRACFYNAIQDITVQQVGGSQDNQGEAASYLVDNSGALIDPCSEDILMFKKNLT